MIVLIDIPHEHYMMITSQKVFTIPYKTADQIIRYFDLLQTPLMVMSSNLHFSVVYGIGD